MSIIFFKKGKLLDLDQSHSLLIQFLANRISIKSHAMCELITMLQTILPLSVPIAFVRAGIARQSG